MPICALGCLSASANRVLPLSALRLFPRRIFFSDKSFRFDCERESWKMPLSQLPRVSIESQSMQVTEHDERNWVGFFYQRNYLAENASIATLIKKLIDSIVVTWWLFEHYGIWIKKQKKQIKCFIKGERSFQALHHVTYSIKEGGGLLNFDTYLLIR